jgi:lysine-N-methylase
LIARTVLLNPVNGPAGGFASIRMNETNQCPLLTGERLCRIHAELGEGMLSHACATYPRVVHRVGGLRETALTLSCPEAARLVLLDADLLAHSGAELKALPLAAEPEDASAIPEHFLEVRATVLALVCNRNYPLWQRLFLLGIFCRRLDSIAQGELQRSVPAFLVDFEATVASGALRTAMETLPVDHAAQLDIVLRLAGMLLHRSNVRPRFVACVEAFTAGIGNGPGATLDSLTANYAAAHDRSYEPFFSRHPHILENYLINTILRCQFPYGREGMKPGRTASMTREYALLTAQFALLKGLLIGVAGFHREQFSARHVVHTVQAAAKHFEHHPEFLNEAHALLVESRMDGARGLAILLRHKSTRRASDGPMPASVAIEAPGALAGSAA